MDQSFRLLPVRFEFRALDRLRFPEGRAGNIVRGAFGASLRRLVCVPECESPKTCKRREVCPYFTVFEPRAPGAGPSGLADRPRPFVLRVHHLNGAVLQPGQAFHLDVHLFQLKEPLLPLFADSFRMMAREGLGPARGRAELLGMSLLNAEGARGDSLLLEGGKWTGACPSPLELRLNPDGAPVRRLLVRFLTATELKAGGAPVAQPEFHVLLARVRDRLSALSALYGEGPLRLDYQGLGERAARVRLLRAGIRRARVTRRSAASGQVHPIGGFLGEAEYAGDLAEFVPLLRAAYWTGVGRQTVWGNGVIQTVIPASGQVLRADAGATDGCEFRAPSETPPATQGAPARRGR
ncbi:MAG: CRISPR system precrRNA processing endoribonuclease RAMP protein Cas6 [Bryobacterales bacterium]|nr:CRISPR system precrRNA processing endoribonuclease RAMP protein Cas6 [Bryobacterales bacterium]